VAPNIKVVESDSVFALQIEVVKDKALWLQLQLHTFETIIKQ